MQQRLDEPMDDHNHGFDVGYDNIPPTRCLGSEIHGKQRTTKLKVVSTARNHYLVIRTVPNSGPQLSL